MNKAVIHLDRSGQASFIGWAGEVNTFADLPLAAEHVGEFYMVLNATGSRFLLNYKAAGLYRSEGGTWVKKNDVGLYLNDDQFAVYNAADNSKMISFNVSSIATGTKRVATWPDKDGTVAMLSDIGSLSIGNFSQTADGVTVVNTTTETSIVGSGVGSLSIPANTFQIGDSFHAKIGGLMSSKKDDQLILRVKNGGTILATTGSFELEYSVADGWEAEIDFTIRTIGATGSIITNGNFCHNKTLDKKYAGTVFQDTKAIDTTILHTLDITAEWVQASNQDSIQASNFVLYKVY
jgi:hypothetical protein